ncbi:MAG: MTH1187 family thiamine-binding protein [Spirochaetota bacterium]
MLASFTIIPIGTGEELKDKIAQITDIVDRSGLPYSLGAMQTTVEGEPDAVMGLIMQCHCHMRELSPRVLTGITIDDREGASNRLTGKIDDVKNILKKDICHE